MNINHVCVYVLNTQNYLEADCPKLVMLKKIKTVKAGHVKEEDKHQPD